LKLIKPPGQQSWGRKIHFRGTTPILLSEITQPLQVQSYPGTVTCAFKSNGLAYSNSIFRPAAQGPCSSGARHRFSTNPTLCSLTVWVLSPPSSLLFTTIFN